MNTVAYKEIKPLLKESFFSPWTTVIEVTGVGERPMRVHARSYFKGPLEKSISRIAGVAQKTHVTGRVDLQDPAFSERRKSGLFVSYQITPVTR